MIIRDIFAKSIDRDLKGVIKVGQAEDENIKQELEEYVVTKELQKHFATFFSNYKRGINGITDKTGVWISGFFGSGKSHFLKIISYILENKTVDGIPSIEYFKRDNKIADSMVLADMKLAANTPSTVILFNIDSKSESNGKKDKEAILSVFLKVFNEKLGFCGAFPRVADLERRLTDEGKYEEFKAKFEEISGNSWIEERTAIDFVQDELVETLVAVDFMSEDAARNWCEKATEPYSMSIDRFAELIKKYIDSKERNHHIIFLVDEIGQYVGDDTDLMLNLQTVTEDLGTACGGKAWVIVTSQQDIDSITKVKGRDFSKIQGRFDTRLSLSSADVAEVIRKRILDKNETGKSSLSILYDDKATVIKNLILFNDDVEKKLYLDRNDFAITYPFVPYQFNLLGSVLTAVRTYGASGKHLADGERSMLALFKESAKDIKDKELGAVVPFYMFYNTLEEFVDHSHSGVIRRAWDNEKINPEHKKECFDVNVLKALFLIKYVKEIKATAENITSLMVSDINEDRLELQQKVEAALKRLEKQMLIQKSAGETYVFLTNEEQEINRAVENQNIEQSEITQKVSELIFDDLFSENKYRAPELNGRYSYGFNRFVDNRPHKANQNFDLTLKVLTPNSDEITDETTLRMLSGQNTSVLVVLPDDSAFLDEISIAIKIEKFLKSESSKAATKYEQIKNDKRVELREHKEQSRVFLEESLKAADIYVNGDIIQSSSKEVSSRLNEALGKLVSAVYHKRNYIDTPTSDSDIRAVFRDNGQQLTLGDTSSEVNKLALNEVADYIARNSARHIKTSMKTLMERFMAPPFGFVEADVQWLVAKLFKDGEIAFYVNNEMVSLISKSADELYRYVTRKEFLEKLMTEKRVKANEKQKKAVRTVMKDLYNYTCPSDDDDTIMNSFINRSRTLKSDLEKLEILYNEQNKYPGRKYITIGKNLLIDVLDCKYPAEFFSLVDSRQDDFLDFAEDYEPIKKFFAGEQKRIWDNAIKQIDIYDKSKNYIVDRELESNISAIKETINKDRPFSEIFKLPDLIDKFRKAYVVYVVADREPVLETIKEARQRVFDDLNESHCKEKFKDRVIVSFDDLKERATHCNNVATLKNIRHEADALKIRFLDEIGIEEDKYLAQKAAQETSTKQATETPVTPTPRQKKRKTVSVKALTSHTTWRIESEEDIKNYTDELERKLKDELEDNTIINVEF
jgi:DNA-binding MarR family transcriptional regulator